MCVCVFACVCVHVLCVHVCVCVVYACVKRMRMKLGVDMGVDKWGHTFCQELIEEDPPITEQGPVHRLGMRRQDLWELLHYPLHRVLLCVCVCVCVCVCMCVCVCVCVCVCTARIIK